MGLATDGYKNSYITGMFTGTQTFGTITKTAYGSTDVFVAKVNNSGQWLWVAQGGGTLGDQGYKIDVDSSGNSYITGCFTGTANFGSTSLVSDSNADIFVAKLDPNGNWLWAVKAQIVNGDEDMWWGICLDDSGNSYFTGHFSGSAILGTTVLNSFGGNDIVVAKLNSMGEWVWVNQVGGSGNDAGLGIDISETGTIAISGGATDSVSFGSIALPGSGARGFVAKLNPDGTWLSAVNGGAGAVGVKVDSSGSCYIVGGFNYSKTWGSITLNTGMDRTDGFVAKLSNEGIWLWAKQYGGNDWDGGYGLGIDNSGNCYITGFYRQSGYFGSIYLSAGGWNRDIFLAKLDSAGNWQWAIKAGAGGHDTGFGMDTDATGNCFVTGWYNSSHYDAVQNSTIFTGAVLVPNPPSIIESLDPIQIYWNNPNQEIDLDDHYESSLPLTFTFSGNSMISASVLDGNILSLTPATDWYGTEYITIRATNSVGYVEQILKVTVIQTWQIAEDFDHEGSVPENWTSSHAGTTDFPWQPEMIEGDDYAMKTMATTGRTANERLFSPTYNLSNYEDIVVSFDTDFLPYGTGSGTFAYTLNNVTYTVVETFSTETTGTMTYTISNLDAKPAVKFRWIYANSSANTGQDNHWIVDDFSIFGVVRDTQAPSAVNGLMLSSQTSSSASLSWQASSDIYFGRYELYVSSDDQVTTTDQLWSAAQDPALYNVDTIQTTITGLATGDYWIAIRAVDQSNNASAISDPVFVQIDGAVPVFSNPTPALQPEPLWINSRTVEIGCSISDFNLIDPNSLNYRIDANGNGIYDDSEAWTALPQAGRQIRNRDELTILFDVSYEADGVLAFEFKATDFYGNIGYSGLSSQEGISDDWVVRIDSSAPVISSPVPVNQPDPDWQQTLAVQIGCTVEDMTTIASIEYRFDNNGNGSYDAEEAWQSYPLSRTGTRDMLIVELPVEFAVDGTRCFEFRATDVLGNVSYSGASGLEGIEDDWVVRMDTTAPTFSDPIPANQPNPVWATLLEVEIGATIYDHNDIDNASIMYRVDLNKNGIYDPEEEWTPLILRYGDYRNSLPINTQITIPGDGVYAFEFKAEDALGNVGYSGLSGINGIEDDWMVMVDTNPPFFSLPIPGDQPLPLWSNNYSVTIGSTILDSLAIDMNSVQYRYDQNQNGIYDTDEIWQNIGLTRNSSVRSVAVEIDVPLILSADGVYKFEFRASDPNEVTGYSGMSQLQGIDDDWIFRIDTVPPADITNFFAEEITDTSVQLTWTASADINFLGYRIHYSTSSEVSTTDPYWDWNHDPNLSNAGTGLVSTVLSGLYPATRYYFMVLATDEVGWITQYPQVITAMTTSSAEPEAPENLSISIVDGLLILNWDDVTQDVLGNPIIPSYYEVFVGDHPDFICNFDSLIATVNESYLELDDVVDYADRLFFKVIAHIGMIRNGK